ncbi:CopM family metallochaperone [Prosthecodimorpha staleyi]|uniref:DUF305 domain-containing protein n=1 Tax=Prosthecodimorpha staleyi TaxID=2840188 RepID=A0A947D3L0_9HYPH|nr:DUF305 domain-containing protein [Prosthecodimorpha staleyi]MBT9290140.1 DUF305 domain-containing protein [Prosthecodimorpha staleyi]
MKTTTLAAALAVGLLATAAFAQSPGMPMQGHGGMHGAGPGAGHGAMAGAAAKPKGDTSPSSLAFAAVNAKMHEGMDITFSGNADIDFVKGMIAHHQGAIDMAKVQLAFGRDDKIKKLSEEIIKAQEGEIAMMKDWLAKNAR